LNKQEERSEIMAKTLKEVRLALAKLDPVYSGEWGERFARQWLNKNNGSLWTSIKEGLRCTKD
jgi:hypothetical protein